MQLKQTVYIVDDDEAILDSLTLFLSAAGLNAKCYHSAIDFIANYNVNMHGCLLLDIEMPAMTGLDLQLKLSKIGTRLPIIIMTGHADVSSAVKAMKNGAFDFIEKPFDDLCVLNVVYKAYKHNSGRLESEENQLKIRYRLHSLTSREAEVLPFLMEGKSAKYIAKQMQISPRTVEIYRSSILLKMQTKSVVQLVRMLHENSIDFSPLAD